MTGSENLWALLQLKIFLNINSDQFGSIPGAGPRHRGVSSAGLTASTDLCLFHLYIS